MHEGEKNLQIESFKGLSDHVFLLPRPFLEKMEHLIF